MTKEVAFKVYFGRMGVLFVAIFIKYKLMSCKGNTHKGGDDRNQISHFNNV